SAALENLIRQIPAAQANNPVKTGFDHSNTQFAALGLWTARRHGVPVDRALARLARHLRDRQLGDGGWCYQEQIASGSTASMTCAGLLGLAVDHGAANDKTLAKDPDTDKAKLRDPGKDPAIRRGLEFLTTFVGDPPKDRTFRPGKLPTDLGK